MLHTYIVGIEYYYVDSRVANSKCMLIQESMKGGYSTYICVPSKINVNNYGPLDIGACVYVDVLACLLKSSSPDSTWIHLQCERPHPKSKVSCMSQRKLYRSQVPLTTRILEYKVQVQH